MIHAGTRTGAVAVRGWLARFPLLLPFIILVVGGIFRFYNLNWDNGHQLHPDERWIFEVVSGANGNAPISWPSSWSQFLDIRPRVGSPLDPHFFAYGSLPFYLLAGVAGTIAGIASHMPALEPWVGIDTYGGLPMLGRGLSAALDLLSVFLVFILARRLYGYWTGVLAMALSAFTVQQIQLAHFYAVDTVLLPLVLLTLIATVDIVQRSSRWPYVWGGMALGAAMATKTTALLLVVPIAGAAFLGAWTETAWPATGSLRQRLRHHYLRVAPQLNANLQWTLASFAIGAIVFAVCEPYALLDRTQLLSDISSQSSILVTNDPPFGVPYTIQYAHTTPYVYQLQNILFWGMGIPLGLTAFAGVLFAFLRNTSLKLRAEEAVLLLWVIPYFLFVGRFFAKFNRYMLPILPVMAILGAALLVYLVQHWRGKARWLTVGALGVVTATSLLYSVAYLNIYEHPNTRVAASRWIFDHLKPGTVIAEEGAWDDPLPMDEQGHSGAQYPELQLNLYDPDDQQKIAHLGDVLSRARYLIMSSERMIGSIPKLPDRYPVTIRYYRLLFAGKLGYRLVAHFAAHPQLGPIVVQDYSADESFHVYDHPDVHIFERVQPVTAGRVSALLTPALAPSQPAEAARLPANPAPDSRLMLTAKQWTQDQQGATLDSMFPPNGFAMGHPILIWLLALELLGLIAAPLAFIMFGNLVDRGLIIAKTIGIVLLGYLVWIGVNLGIAPYGQPFILAVLALLAVLSAFLWYRCGAEMVAFARREWRRLLAAELVFLVGFAIFIALRMWYPDLGHQFSPVAAANDGGGRMGEKQMELAFLNAIVRSRVFPPYDPFFAHGYINYYYYGFYLVATICKLTEIVPATGFNLAIATFFGLLVGNVYSVALSLTKRIVPGVVAAVFVGLIGNLNAAWQLVSGLIAVSPVHDTFPLVGGVVDTIAGGLAVVFRGQSAPTIDFWGPTRIIPPVGGPISEFPYFTYLFADLHPHLMAFPLTVAAIALAINLLLGPYGGLRSRLLSLLLGGILLGAIAVTNPWDFPTYVVVIGLGALVGGFVLDRRWRPRHLLRPLLWMGALGVLTAVLYRPFEQSYQTVFVTGLGLVRDITPEQLRQAGLTGSDARDALVTPLHIYLEHFGLFLFVLASYLLSLLWVDTGARDQAASWLRLAHFAFYYRDRLPRVRRAIRVGRRVLKPRPAVVDGSVLAGILILLAGLIYLQDFLLAFLCAGVGIIALLLQRLGKTLAPEQYFTLALVLVPLAISLVTQVVYVKDWLAGDPHVFRMNTIFKFYNQAWVLFALTAACSLSYLLTRPAQARQREALHGSITLFKVRRLGPLGEPAEEESGAGIAALRAPVVAAAGGATLSVAASADATSALIPFPASGASEGAPVPPQRRVEMRGEMLSGFNRRPWWSLSFFLLLLASLVYTWGGTISRETYRTSWLPENSVPFTLDGMAFMRVAYPEDYAAISWLNGHVTGAPVIAEAGGAYYNWRSRVSMFTGLPTIVNGIHEAEQRYDDELNPSDLCGQSRDPAACSGRLHSRTDDVQTLYSSPRIGDAWRIIRRYGVRYIYVGFSERQCTQSSCYSKAGLAKFDRMVGHGLRIAFRRDKTTIYQVTSA